VKSSGWWLVGTAVAATALAIVFRSATALTATLSLLAVGAAAGLLFSLISDRLPAAPTKAAPPVYPVDLLERAFESGELGRERVIRTIEALQGRVFTHPRRLTPDEVRSLTRSGDAAFRDWVTERLDALEEGS